MSDSKREELPQGWITFEEFSKWVQDRVMANGKQGVEFVLSNWNCKYVNARIDMRTGFVHLSPGAEG